jgi:2-polyprenyl-3-methyl-5-hydroxy-6-metoxy-1,4-benzoquinol methylase
MGVEIISKEWSDRELAMDLREIYSRSSISLSALERLKTIYRPYYAPIKEIFPYVRRGGTVLDLGCGRGPILFLLSRHRDLKRGLGVDRDARAIEVARGANADPRIAFGKGTIFDYPEQDLGLYDCIICFDLFHHLPQQEREKLIPYVAGAMRRGTVLIFKDLEGKRHWRSWANSVTDWLSSGSLVTYTTMEAVLEWFQSIGFEIVYTAYSNKWVWAHMLVVAQKP